LEVMSVEVAVWVAVGEVCADKVCVEEVVCRGSCV